VGQIVPILQYQYSRICLDVLPEFTAARKLYESLDFAPSEPVNAKINLIATKPFRFCHQ